MAKEPKERKAFEAHMRVGGYSNHDKHPDGSYVSSAMELWWQGWKARAQLPSQGGEAVEVVAVAFITRAEKSGPKIAITLKKEDAEKQHKNWLSMSKIITTEPLMTVAQHQRILAAATHPADQVADDLTMVKASRELLEQIAVELEHDNDRYFLGRELRALLNGGRS